MATADINSDVLRPLGNNEVSADSHHHLGDLTTVCAVQLCTRSLLDQEMVRYALLHLQQTFPQLRTWITTVNGQKYFASMDCSVLKFDIEKCEDWMSLFEDMLQMEFNNENGPLWCAKLVRLNRSVSSVDSFHRGAILFALHPAISDTESSFHLCKQLVNILDVLLEGTDVELSPEQQLHHSVESLLPQKETSFHWTDVFTLGKVMANFVVPKKSLFLQKCPSFETEVTKAKVLTAGLDTRETKILLELCEEDDATVHGVISAAGLIALSNVLHDGKPPEHIPLRTIHEVNLRCYCTSTSQTSSHASPSNITCTDSIFPSNHEALQYGSHCTCFEETFTVPIVNDKNEFWKFAHEISIKLKDVLSSHHPLKLLRVHGKVTGNQEGMLKDLGLNHFTPNEMGVAVYGDIGKLFRHNKNIELENVLHSTWVPHMTAPFVHAVHIFHEHLNYMLHYCTTFVAPEQAEDYYYETLSVLKMAVMEQTIT